MSVVLENRVMLTADADAVGWSRAIQTAVSLPRAYTIAFHVDEREWGVVVSQQPDGTHWLVSTSSTGVPTISKYDPVAATYTTCITTGQGALPLQADVKIAFREMRFGDASTEAFYTISFWANGRLVLSHSEPAGSSPLVSPLRFGFAVPPATTRRFLNLRIPELSMFLDWISIDPGESAMGGLQRAIEGQHVKFFMRWNGTIRAWRPKASDVARTYDDVEERSIQVDLRGLKTHVRMIGGYAQAEVHRADLTRQHGHRFAELNNPYLLSESECHEQALIAIQKMEEAAVTEGFTVEYNPLIEPEDHVVTPGGHHRIVNERSVSYEPGYASDNISSRSYVYDT